MTDDFTSLKNLRQTYGRLTLVSLFTWAFLHSVHPFFSTFFFWIAAGLALITLVYHVVIKQKENPSPFQSRPSRPSPEHNVELDNAGESLSAKGKWVGIAAAGIFIFFFLSIVLAIIFSDDNDDNTYSEYYVDSQTYDRALTEYNALNYEKTIAILRPIMLSGNQDSQAMLLLGDGYYELKNLDSAYVWYAKAYEAGQRSAILSHLMAYILDTKGRITDAVPLYKESVGMDSTRVEIFSRLAELEPENSAWYLQKAEQFKSASESSPE